MGFLKGLFGKSWEPLICKPADIIDLFRELEAIEAPVCSFIIEHNGVEHEVGIASDYSEQQGFFDTVYYLDEQTFSGIEDFCSNSKIDERLFVDLRKVRVLEEVNDGDPRNLVLLAKREIKE